MNSVSGNSTGGTGGTIVIILSIILIIFVMIQPKKADPVEIPVSTKVQNLELNKLSDVPLQSDQTTSVAPIDIIEYNPNFNGVYLEKQGFPNGNHSPVDFQAQIDKSIRDQSIPNYLQNSLWFKTVDLPDVRYVF